MSGENKYLPIRFLKKEEKNETFSANLSFHPNYFNIP